MNARTKRIRDAKPRGHYYLGDIDAQLAGIRRKHSEAVVPFDIEAAAAACRKRIVKFYELDNKYCKANGWTKRPDQR